MSRPWAPANVRPGHRAGIRHPRIKGLAWMLLCAVPAAGVVDLWLRDRMPFPALWYVGASLMAFLLYRHDKQQAGAAGQRIPEKWLHAVGLLGGWPGALLAQQIYRHKTRKVSFQVVCWLIVLVHVTVWAGRLWSEWGR